MTDFNKIENYYKKFDEKNRLINDNSGRLEYEMTMKILENELPKEGVILDLGGAAGAYSFPLAEKGYKVYLADLSKDLIEQAIARKTEEECKNLVSCDVVNAIDLSIYEDNLFDVVLAFEPLYHLLEENEREKCVAEINRVLKPGGKVFVSFIPYLSGSIAIIDRLFRHPEQVDLSNLTNVFETGKFNNATEKGFQEGYYPTSNEIEKLFFNEGFKKIAIKSIRGLGYEKEDKIYSIDNEEIFNKIIELITKTAEDKSIVEMCGHAMYIGSKL